MPIVYDCPQNTPEWLQARLSLPTASEFGRIVTPTGKLSKQADAYAWRLLAEWLTGAPLEDGYESRWMERGHSLEDDAIADFSFTTGKEVTRCGFVTNDAGTVGCSPDGLIGTTEGIELKAPSPQVHVGYLLARSVADEYKPQVQGNLLVTEREKWYVVAYHPGLPTSIIEAHRDEPYIALLRTALDEFCDRLEVAKEELRSLYGVVPRPKVGTAPPVEDKLGFDLTDDDVAKIYARSRGGVA